MSRFLSRAATVAAGVSIVLLVVLLIILWTGVRSGQSISGDLKSKNVHYYDDYETTIRSEERRGKFMEASRANHEPTDVNSETPPSMMFDRMPHRFDVRTNNQWDTPNPTDDVGSESASVKAIEDHGLQQDNFDQHHVEEANVNDFAKETVEHVSPKKTHQNIYEDPADSATATRHHTGHFRHSTAAIWDPHPQYEFKAFGKDFHLLLSQDSSFVSPDIKVTHVRENSTRREHPGHQLGCFYSGTVKGDPKSVVSVSLCHGMSGHIRTSSGNYFIEPVDRSVIGEQGTADKPVIHVIYLASATRSNSNSVNLPEERNGDNDCVLIDTIEEEAPALLIDDVSGSTIDVGKLHPRERRSISRKTSIDQSIENDNLNGREDDDDDDDDDDDEFRRHNLHEFVRHNERRQFSGRHERLDSRYFSTEHQNYQKLMHRESEFENPFETWRPRRALPQEYFIEIMIVADKKMAEYHGTGLTNYVLVLMSTVSRIYKDPSIGNAITIVVVKIETVTDPLGTRHPENSGIAANEMLKNFCLWQKHAAHPNRPTTIHHDAALLLTRENLCHDAKQNRCDTLGLAELGRMCVPRSSCAIVQDNGLAAAFTIAHEIGHVLSMPHDDDEKCQPFTGNTKIHNVMSRMLDANTFPWEWSNCSRHYVTEFLDSGYGYCLLDQPNANEADSHHVRLPGEDYPQNKQCELVFGSGSIICPYMVSDVCRRLWCTAPVWDVEEQCHTQHMPWADGTACARGKWCHRGECVSRKFHRPIDGQWGPWQDYGECSRTCGGGITKRYRQCNNPPPQHGGNYCTGTRVEYRSCATNDCPPGSLDFREQQCSSFNNNNRNIRNLQRDVKWHAKYTLIQPTDRCKLYCQVESNQYYMLKDKVIDGTPCSLDSFDMCVNGICKAAGCDHMLNSTAELDTCGVCRGDNSSCQRITGTYNVSMYGYNRVTKIPAGSSYIDIRQYGWRGTNDSNYLAVRNAEGGKYILNGNSMIAHSKQLREPGIALDYTGPESSVERLNGSRPILSDLILEVLSVGNLSPPQISYEYTVPKNILTSYTWVLSDWSACNRVCHGTRYRIVECRSAEHKDVVSDDYCRAEDKPREQSQMCNIHCNVMWNIVSKSECSSHCGPGTRTVTSQCIHHNPTGSQPISDHHCKHFERPAEIEACTGPCDDSHWLYGEWGACSVTCKGGIQMRTATCVDSNGQSVSESNCNSQEKVVKQICGQGPCPRWTLGWDWSPCSVTCGTGIQKLPVWCQIDNRVVGAGYCDDSPPAPEKKCDMGPCPVWQPGEWSMCSVSCGKGIAQRDVSCRRPNSPLTLNASYCNSTMPPENTRICMHAPCHVQTVLSTPIIYPIEPGNEIDSIPFHPSYRWRTGSFGECSKSCDTGHKSRAVKCSSAETGDIVDDQYCDFNQKPQDVRTCNEHACPRWNTGDWSQCNSECGPGYKHRQVHCQTKRGETLPDNDCAASERPHHVDRCMRPACVPGKAAQRINHRIVNDNNNKKSIKWRMSRWSPCSKTCGHGTKTRKVDCIANSSAGEVTEVNERECIALGRRKPKSQRQCQRIPCDLSWQEGTWSECSAECGNGVQKRSVTCHRVNRYGWIDPMIVSGCKISDKPAQEQPCKLRECDDEYSWAAGPWKKCSAPCGKGGKQGRPLFCNNRSGNRVAKKFCPIKFRPQRRRKCNQHRCGVHSCLEAKKRYKTIKDAEYSISIGGKSMSIYCHNMTGNQPLEYLTLPAGDHENFAEMYDKRLLDPSTCPSSGRRNENCKCVNDGGSTSGKTMFRRVRLDPTTLVVIVDDFTFSWTKGSKRVEFGKAGDCYSKLKCPQGEFSINLQGTQLRLSPELSWVNQGSMTSSIINKINQQKVIGKCGGYCGSCKLARGLKLDVLPP